MREYAPIALFCYNRVDLLQQTVAALQKNALADKCDLFIFADGAKSQAGIRAVNEVREYIRTVSGFRRVIIKEAEKNLGLAKSIISGVTEVVNKYGRIIVIEDDIVTAPYFLQWMNDALDMYEQDEQVAGIHGWTPPEKFGKRPETYFVREVGCWGWATWKRGWDIFEADGKKLLEQFSTKRMIYDFNQCYSYPYYQMLKEQVAGTCDSWAIRWYASVFLKNKVGLWPGRTLVANIGFSSGSNFDAVSHIPKDVISSQPPRLERPKNIVSADNLLKTVYKNYNKSYFSVSKPNDCRTRFLLSMFREEVLTWFKNKLFFRK